MNNLSLRIIAFALLATTLFSCKKNDDDNSGGNGTATISFSNRAGIQPLVLNTQSYTNTQGASLTFTKFNYYISNIRLINTSGGSFAEDYSYHLVQQEDPSSCQFNIANVPAGTYSSISFMIGVDSTHNVSGAQTGALDPGNGMFWSWNTGYIMAKMEGTSPQSTATDNSFIFHIGGFSGANSGVRNIALTFPTPLVISKDKASIAYLHADALAWFNPNLIDLATLHFLMSVNADSKKIADNYANMFAADSVKN